MAALRNISVCTYGVHTCTCTGSTASPFKPPVLRTRKTRKIMTIAAIMIKATTTITGMTMATIGGGSGGVGTVDGKVAVTLVLVAIFKSMKSFMNLRM